MALGWKIIIGILVAIAAAVGALIAFGWKVFAGILIVISFVAAVGALIVFFIGSRKRGRSFNTRLVFFSLILIISAWFQRMAVGVYDLAAYDPGSDAAQTETAEKEKPLNPLEMIFNSAIHTMQSFSLDEDYTEHITQTKEMFKDVTGCSDLLAGIYGGITAFFDFGAAFAGGAVLVTILAGLFPALRLMAVNLFFGKRNVYYFSELNERALTLAKSFLKNPHEKKKPIIIFTDAYGDDEIEQDAELLSGARQIGAICLREDLAQIQKKKAKAVKKSARGKDESQKEKKKMRGKRKYFLIDDEEMGNLQAITGLTDEKNREYIRNAEIYLFSRYDFYTQVEKQVRDRLEKEAGFKPTEMPTITPIQSYKNLVCNLLCKVPLYEPLVQKERNERGKVELNVTILGAGIIGTEMFLAVYWFGQMLDVDLTINVVSAEDEDSFWKKIDFINPEIRQTTIASSKILEYNKKGKHSDPYCTVNYFQADVKSWKFLELGGENGRKLRYTDYFMVALGSDELNIQVAQKLHGYIGRQHIEEYIRAKTLRKTVIAYVVYDSELCKILNRTKRYGSVNEDPDIYMQAFGSLEEVYDSENIFMSRHTFLAKKMGNAYWQNARMLEENRIRIDENKDYTHWANLSRAMHISYKVFSLGWIDHSVFDPDGSEESSEEQKDRKNEAFRWHAVSEYMLIATKKTSKAIELMKSLSIDKDAIEAQERQFKEKEAALNDTDNGGRMWHRMAWLEHRRWNAFGRTRGFMGTRLLGRDPETEGESESSFAIESYIGLTGSREQMTLEARLAHNIDGRALLRSIKDSVKGRKAPKKGEQVEQKDTEESFAFDVYYDTQKSYKHMPLKLHPCIVECSENGPAIGEEDSDYLDDLSAHMRTKKDYSPNFDFKEYDYPDHDYDSFKNTEVKLLEESEDKKSDPEEIHGIYSLIPGKDENAGIFSFKIVESK